MAEETVPGYAVAPPPQVRNPEEDGRLDSASRGRLIGILVMLALYSEVVPFQYAMSAVLTPLVGKSFPAAGDNVTWMITIIGVVGGGTMALVAKMADIWGKKRMLLGCSGVFFAGSVLCATTTSWPLFLTGRGLQAMALGMSALCYSLVRDIMPRSWIPISIGFIGTGLGVSAVAGPMIAGALTDHYSWRSIFWFLAIYMVVVIPAFVAIVPDSPLRIRQRLDIELPRLPDRRLSDPVAGSAPRRPRRPARPGRSTAPARLRPSAAVRSREGRGWRRRAVCSARFRGWRGRRR
jgi:MFS family permease